jgi:hypothetical protein
MHQRDAARAAQRFFGIAGIPCIPASWRKSISLAAFAVAAARLIGHR